MSCCTRATDPAALPTPGRQCFHCASPVPEAKHPILTHAGVDLDYCCSACLDASATIMDAGLADYYRWRTASSKPTVQPPSRLGGGDPNCAYADPLVERALVRSTEGGTQAYFSVEGMSCSACAWLIESRLSQLPGVLEVEVSYANHRSRVRWQPGASSLTEIINAIKHLGFRATPYDPERRDWHLEEERRRHLRRLGIAGVFGMQVMMASIALYAGHWYGIEAHFRDLLRWLCAGLTVPVLLYAAQPFFVGAARSIRTGAMGMDVPVSAGLTLAFGASVHACLTSGPHVYFDSVVMFVFFLLLARYVEFMVRRRSAQQLESTFQPIPTTATRMDPDGTHTPILATALAPGDVVLVRPGEEVPADGTVISGESTVDEGLLTGESRPVGKAPGARIYAGSTNFDHPLRLRVTHRGAGSLRSRVLELLEQASAQKPRAARVADRSAGYFILGVLVLAAVVAGYWLVHDASRWLAITVSVLVVTCPCALSLATPAALTGGLSALGRLGLIATNGDALENLAQSNHVVFDKTGTLTRGRPRVLGVQGLGTTSSQECLAIAAAMEQYSEHPVARAFCGPTLGDDPLGDDPLGDASTGDVPTGDSLLGDGGNPALRCVENVTNVPGRGLLGEVDNQSYAIGSRRFIEAQLGREMRPPPGAPAPSAQSTEVVLATSTEVLAAFQIGDELRPESRSVVAGLLGMGIPVALYSGDRAAPVREVARALQISNARAELDPEEKVRAVQALRDGGRHVLMVGDGLNDAPVLSAAATSVAMATGATLSKVRSDFVLMADDLTPVYEGIKVARRTRAIIKQNMTWAVLYNLLALPAAALGWIPPWAAALGMSASSLVVVLNSRRAGNYVPETAPQT